MVAVVSQKEDNGLLYNIRDAGMLKNTMVADVLLS